MYEGKKIVKSMIFIALILIVSMSNMLYSQKNKYGKYPADRPIPNIKEYPPAIQRLDQAKVSYINKLREVKMSDDKAKVPQKYIKNFARNFISAYLFYSDLEQKGIFYDYYIKYGKPGPEIFKDIQNLQYPWNFLIYKSGIVLAEAINDTILPKKYHPFAPPSLSYNYVLEVKVLDDIFGTIEEDKFLVRHDHSILNYDYFSDNDDVRILFTLKPGGTIQRENSVERIYIMGEPTEFMFVINDIIYDPNKVLGISGKKYQDFKQELLDFIEQEGIRP